MKIHIVQKGDTMWKIAKKYGVDFKELLRINSQIKNPDNIMPGMKVRVPSNSISIKPKGNNSVNNEMFPRPQKEMPVPMPMEEESPMMPMEQPDSSARIMEESQEPIIPMMPRKEMPIPPAVPRPVQPAPMMPQMQPPPQIPMMPQVQQQPIVPVPPMMPQMQPPPQIPMMPPVQQVPMPNMMPAAPRPHPYMNFQMHLFMLPHIRRQMMPPMYHMHPPYCPPMMHMMPSPMFPSSSMSHYDMPYLSSHSKPPCSCGGSTQKYYHDQSSFQYDSYAHMQAQMQDYMPTMPQVYENPAGSSSHMSAHPQMHSNYPLAQVMPTMPDRDVWPSWEHGHDESSSCS